MQSEIDQKESMIQEISKAVQISEQKSDEKYVEYENLKEKYEKALKEIEEKEQ